jgi:ribosomal protein L44E
MDGTEMRMVDSMRLRCQECARPSDDAARGWRMYLGPDPDEPDAPPMLATYCRECAEREFDLHEASASASDA